MDWNVKWLVDQPDHHLLNTAPRVFTNNKHITFYNHRTILAEILIAGQADQGNGWK
jgi:hypothetical protein